MGPEGGDMGGMVIAKGTPEQVAEVEESYTGYYIRKVLGKERINTHPKFH
jgi:excinuclease ABC subunit A